MGANKPNRGVQKSPNPIPTSCTTWGAWLVLNLTWFRTSPPFEGEGTAGDNLFGSSPLERLCRNMKIGPLAKGERRSGGKDLQRHL
jgi:hypothetical protein